MSIKVYIASKVNHAPAWKRVRSEHLWGEDVEIIAQWIDETHLGREHELTQEFLTNVWIRNEEDLRSADVLVIYAEPGEILRGALIEAGIFLGLGKHVLIVGTDLGNPHSRQWGSWQFHPNVHWMAIDNFDDLSTVIHSLSTLG